MALRPIVTTSVALWRM